MKNIVSALVQKAKHRLFRRTLRTGMGNPWGMPSGGIGRILAMQKDEMKHKHACGHTAESHFVAEVLAEFAQAQGIPADVFIAACRSAADPEHWAPQVVAAMHAYDSEMAQSSSSPVFMAPQPLMPS